ncbi:MAG: nuclear transport factor 2 family protein [Robiginitomaculum sp.]|nr:nuclear transport factor 2 family protein [Robiginitomaculum sp.]
MKKISLLIIMTLLIFVGCTKQSAPNYSIEGSQSQAIKEMIDAVNEKNAEKYVEAFAENVQVFVGAEMKIEGRDALQANRANHFKNHPDIRSEIQHLVEVDNKVIMHDKLWLKKSDTKGSDLVEIFTFENGKVVKIDVIQPKDLFQ